MFFILLFITVLIVMTIYLVYTEIPRYVKTCQISPNDLYSYEEIYSRKRKIKNVVISLTTTPDRIHELAPTLASLFTQTVRVDQIYLNLPTVTLKGKHYVIPDWLKQLKTVKICRTVRDFGPATKLLPTLVRLWNSPKTMIIVIDDDVIYGSKTIEFYINEFYRHGEKKALTIFGGTVNNGEIGSEWPSFLNWSGPSSVNIVKGHNSFLVTPEMFPLEVFQYSNAPSECIWVDDVWWSGWLRYNGYGIHGIGCVHGCIPITKWQNREGLCDTENKNKHNNNTAILFFKDKGIF